MLLCIVIFFTFISVNVVKKNQSVRNMSTRRICFFCCKIIEHFQVPCITVGMPIFVKNLWFYGTYGKCHFENPYISFYVYITPVVVLDMCYDGTVDRISAPYLVKQSLHVKISKLLIKISKIFKYM